MKLLSWPKEPRLLYAPCPVEFFAKAARSSAETVRVPIPDHDGYAADGLGRIYSEITQRELRPSFADSSGRARVELRGGYRPKSGRKSQRFYVARLVLRTFHGPPPCYDCWICHINGDKSDNRATNLKWGLPPLLRRQFDDAQDVREVKRGYYVDRFGNGWSTRDGKIVPYQFNTARWRAYVVARHFLGERPPGHSLCFKDGNKNNLTVENLSWIPRPKGSGFGFFKLLKQQNQLKQAIERYEDGNSNERNGTNEPTGTETVSDASENDGRYTITVTDYFG